MAMIMHHLKKITKKYGNAFHERLSLSTLLDSVRSKYQNLEQVASYLPSPKIA